MKAGLVLTTIHDPVVLEDYYSNFVRHGHLDDVQVFIIPDKKTPAEAYKRCESLRKNGMKLSCPSLEEQDAYLRRVGFRPNLVPYNSDNRRNIGFLMALEQGVDFIVSIDDDNFCLPNQDFISEHSVVCQPKHSMTVVNTVSGWFNICNMLELKPQHDIYPRGFPYKHRHKDGEVSFRSEEGVVRMNAGLWLSEPDLDAMTWLVSPVRATAFKEKPLVLGEKTWSPINTQNTALHRDVMPSYYYVRMGCQMAGMTIDRYGDIFSGYFSQACLRHFGHRVRIGTPIAEHRRNAHNYLHDATKELACIWVLEDLTEWLREVKLEGSTYSDTYNSLSHAIEDAVEQFSGFIWTDTTRGYFHEMAYCMREWLKACRCVT